MDNREIRTSGSAADDADADRRAREWINRRIHLSRREMLRAWGPSLRGKMTLRTSGAAAVATARAETALQSSSRARGEVRRGRIVA